MQRPYGGIKGEQLKLFLQKKAKNPEEVMATVTFLDVNGHQCPSRQFRIFKYETRLYSAQFDVSPSSLLPKFSTRQIKHLPRFLP
jgi:hypothetical protein